MAYIYKFINGSSVRPIAAPGSFATAFNEIVSVSHAVVCGFINGQFVGLPVGDYIDYSGRRWTVQHDATNEQALLKLNGNTIGGNDAHANGVVCFIINTTEAGSTPALSLSVATFRPQYQDISGGSGNIIGNFCDNEVTVGGVMYTVAEALYKSVGYGKCTITNARSNGTVYVNVKFDGPRTGVYPYTSMSTIGLAGPSLDDQDPYGDDEGDGDGGEGDHDDDTDEIDEPDLPDIGATDTGLITIFRPNKYQLKALSEYFWSSDILHFLQNQVEGISDMFIGLGIVPINIPSGGVVNVKWLGLNTGVELTLCGQQYFTIDCGSVEVKEYWGSALDYSPYTTIQIYLPFIGSKSLDVDEVMNKTLNVKYHVDIASGTCVAFIIVDGTVMYQFTGNVVTEIPLTSVNYDAMITNATNMALAASAYHAASGAHTEAQQMLNDASTKAEINRADGYVKSTQNTLNAKGQQLAGSSVSAVMGSKPHFEKTGSIAASAGMLAIKKPYLTIIRPRMSRPEHYNHYVGLPCNKEIILSTLTGFTVIEDIRLNDLVATSDEIAEIYELLRKGVIL